MRVFGTIVWQSLTLRETVERLANQSNMLGQIPQINIDDFKSISVNCGCVPGLQLPSLGCQTIAVSSKLRTLPKPKYPKEMENA